MTFEEWIKSNGGSTDRQRLYKAVNALCLQAGTETDETKSTHWLSWSPFPRKQKPIERKQKEALITHKEFW